MAISERSSTVSSQAKALSNGLLDKGIKSLFEAGDETETEMDLTDTQIKVMRRLLQGHHKGASGGSGGSTTSCTSQDFIHASTNSDPARLHDLARFLDGSRRRNPIEWLFESKRKTRYLEGMEDDDDEPEAVKLELDAVRAEIDEHLQKRNELENECKSLQKEIATAREAESRM